MPTPATLAVTVVLAAEAEAEAGAEVQLTPGRFIKNPGIRNLYKLRKICGLMKILHTKVCMEAKQ